MKKFLIGLFLLCETASPCFSKEYRLNGTNDLLLKPKARAGEKSLVVSSKNSVATESGDFVLMSPVKLSNPEKVNYGFDAGLPLYYNGEKSGVKKKVVKKSEPVVENKAEVVSTVAVVDNSPKQGESVALTTTVVENNNVVAGAEVKAVDAPSVSVKVETAPVSTSTENAPAPAPVSAPAPVVAPTPAKVEEKSSVSKTDKNIDEAKKLLEVAENIAKTVATEVDNNEKKVSAKLEKQGKVVSDVKADLTAQKAKTGNGKLSNFSVKFANADENLKKADVDLLNGVAVQLIKSADTNVKIVSYYSSVDDRNTAFSRLLNTRKILLEKNVPTSQIMIMVLEDKAKSNTVEVLFD